MSRTEENYGPSLKFLDFVLWLQGSASGVTLDEIADQYSVERRTAERMRDAVKNYFAGDFKESRDGKQKCFKLRAKKLDAIIMASVSEEELAAFPTAVQLLRRNKLEIQATALEGVAAKLRALLKLDMAKSTNLEERLRLEGLVMRPGPRRSYDDDVLRKLREAMMTFHQIKTSYTNREGRLGDYTLIPLGFLYGERHHYLVARHADGYMDGEPHSFVLARIKSVEILAADFEEDKNFNLADYAARSFGAYQEEPFEVEWLFSPAVTAEAENFIFHPSQQMTHRPDGSLSVRFTAGGRLEMAWHLQTWGKEVTVVKPVDFWDTLPEF